MILKLDIMQPAIDSLVCGAAKQDLASSREAYKGFRQTDYITAVLHLPCHMMHLHASGFSHSFHYTRLLPLRSGRYSPNIQS